MALSQKVIKERMIELRNLRKLHAAARTRIVSLEKENKELKACITELRAENKTLRADLTDIKYQLSELQTILFGKRKHIAQELEDDDDDEEKPPPTPRTPASYQRPIPPEYEVTKTIYHRFPRTSTNKQTRTKTYFIEDIPLGLHKLVTKHVVEQRYDTKQRIWVSQSPLPTTTVTLGDNVRVLIATLITVERLSFSQVHDLLMMLFQLSVSDGEITKILNKEAVFLKPAEETLLDSIRSESSHHLDESRYDVAGQTRYGWSIVGGESGDSVYLLGVSRGKGMAEKLRGDSGGVLISDDYGVYRNLAEKHQLCFAHLIRKFRDLTRHEGFTDAERKDIESTYSEIKTLYQRVMLACSLPDPGAQYEELTQRFAAVSSIRHSDPKPVARLKKTLARNVAKYLTCLTAPFIALTNNIAERSLRHIVLKRKNSFGCKSDQGASTLGTLLSVLLSLYRRDPATYLEKYLVLRGV